MLAVKVCYPKDMTMKFITKTAIAAAASALCGTSALAYDFGNGLSLVGSVELEYVDYTGSSESFVFSDVTLSWRSQAGGAIGFGFDLSLDDVRSLDGGSDNNIWASLVVTTGNGEFAIGRPRPVLDGMFVVPAVGGVDIYDLEVFGLFSGSYVASAALMSDADIVGMTYKGSAGALSYGVGLHHLSDGPMDADAFEAGLTYTMGSAQVFAAYESLDAPGPVSLDKVQIGARYDAANWSVGVLVSDLESGPFKGFSSNLFGDYQINDALSVGVQVTKFGGTIFGDETLIGLTGTYSSAMGAFAELGVITDSDMSDEVFSASVGYEF